TVVEPPPVRVHFLSVVSGVLVALPGVHREAPRVQPIAEHRLAEGRIGHTIMGAELDEHPRAGGADDPVRERHVAEPGAHDAGPPKTPTRGIELWRPERPEQLDLSRWRGPTRLVAVNSIRHELCRHPTLTCGGAPIHSSTGTS